MSEVNAIMVIVGFLLLMWFARVVDRRDDE
jgi:hypothetical protein